MGANIFMCHQKKKKFPSLQSHKIIQKNEQTSLENISEKSYVPDPQGERDWR